MNRYRLEVAAAGDIMSYIDNVSLLWTQLPDISWERIKRELLPWYDRMAHFGVIIASKHDYKTVHEMEETIEDSILRFTDEGDLVVDPFCGSSTVGAIALTFGRVYYGCDISQMRIDDSEAKLSHLMRAIL